MKQYLDRPLHNMFQGDTLLDRNLQALNSKLDGHIQSASHVKILPL